MDPKKHVFFPYIVKTMPQQSTAKDSVLQYLHASLLFYSHDSSILSYIGGSWGARFSHRRVSIFLTHILFQKVGTPLGEPSICHCVSIKMMVKCSFNVKVLVLSLTGLSASSSSSSSSSSPSSSSKSSS